MDYDQGLAVLEDTRQQVAAWGFRGNVFGQMGNFLGEDELDAWKNEAASLNLESEIASVQLRVKSKTI
jgi:hypothetical protein